MLLTSVVQGGLIYPMKLLQIAAKEGTKTDLRLNPGMNELAESLAGPMWPDTSEAARDHQHRATQVTGVLEDILHNYGHVTQPPVHWGINE